MVGARNKPPGMVVNARGGKVRVVSVGERPADWRRPQLPRECTRPFEDPVQARFHADALQYTRLVWREWWDSTAALAVDMKSDGEAIRWWIICVFRRSLYVQIVREQPLVKGANSAIPNPLSREIRMLTADINRAADRFGMDTLARFRLHFEMQGEKRVPEPPARPMLEEERPDPRHVLREVS